MFGMFRGGWKQIALLGGATLIVIVLFHQAIAQAFRGDPVFQAGGRLLAQGRQVLDSPPIYFAPDHNLERLDIDRLRRTRSRLDISMYAFTDRELAEVLKELAGRGTVIRLYRDQEQFAWEQAQARGGFGNTTALLRGVLRLHIRVKGGARRDLMHQKDYCIDCGEGSGVLREGSANWSVGAERFQDNALWFTSNPSETEAFERKFEEMWARPSNRIVQ